MYVGSLIDYFSLVVCKMFNRVKGYRKHAVFFLKKKLAFIEIIHLKIKCNHIVIFILFEIFCCGM